MAGIIATEKEAYLIGSGGLDNPSQYTENLCCTRARAEAFGCYVPSSYANNQLVEKSHLQQLGFYIAGTIANAVSVTINDSITFEASAYPQEFRILLTEPYKWSMGINTSQIYDGGIDIVFDNTYDVETKITNYHNIGVSIVEATNRIFINVGTRWDPDGTISGDIIMTTSDGKTIEGQFNYE